MEGCKKTVLVNTKQYQGGDSVRTKLTIDATALTVEDMMEYVIDSATIKWQASIRRKKDSTIPTEATYVVPKPGTRASAVETPSQFLIRQFGFEKTAVLIEKYGSAEKVIEAMKAIL